MLTPKSFTTFLFKYSVLSLWWSFLYGPFSLISQLLSLPFSSFVLSPPVTLSCFCLLSSVFISCSNFFFPGMRNDNATSILCACLTFIFWWLFSHYPLWLKQGVSEQDGAFNYLNWMFLTNGQTNFLTLETFLSPDWNQPIRSMVSDWHWGFGFLCLMGYQPSWVI